MTMPTDPLALFDRTPQFVLKLLELGARQHVQDCGARALAEGHDLSTMMVVAAYRPDAKEPFSFGLAPRNAFASADVAAVLGPMLAGPFPPDTIPVVRQSPGLIYVFVMPLPPKAEWRPYSAARPCGN